MLAISVLQPWAWAIARGHKLIENRDHSTEHRGALLIHASMRVDLAACDSPLIRAAGWGPQDPLTVLGAIVAVVELTDICEPDGPCDCGPWAEPGAYHWRFTNVRPLDRPVVALGRASGLWTPRAGVLSEIGVDSVSL